MGSKLQNALGKLNRITVVDDEVLNTILKEICGALLESDVQVKLVRQLRDNVKLAVNLEDSSAGTNRRRLIQKTVVDQLIQMLEPEAKPYKMKKGQSNVVMFVGLQGSGKTTSIAKYAHYYQRKGWKTCMVCADTFRAGAFDQLKQNATKLRIPFYGSYTEADPVRIAEEGVAQFRAEHYELILVDTSGRHKQEADLFAEMREVAAAVKPDDVVFVMDSSIGQAVYDQASAFRQTVDVGSVIITKLDGHAKGGGALSAVAATGSPIIFYGTGEHFADFEDFNAQSFVSRLMGMGDIRGLMEEVKHSGMLENQEEMVQKFQKGVFTLRDMYKQFESVMKMGPLSKVMQMIPGLPQGMSQMLNMGGGEEENTKRLRRFLYMMDSMTDAELDGATQINASRQMRIARGSGCQVYEVEFLLKCHKQFSQVVSRMGKSGLMKAGDAALGKQMARNPNAVMQQLSKAMDPKMMAQMGGAQNMMRMVKQMQNMDPGQLSEIAALVIRIALILYGEVQDKYLHVKYTDVDYDVYTDAAREVLAGNSPFDRTTYRYTPVLAYMMIPNVVMFEAFGKLLFVACDLLVGYELYTVLALRGLSSSHALYYTSVCLFHPFSINISTRGNADSIVVLLVVVSLRLLMRKQLVLAAIVYSAAVHFKIYPIVYALAILVLLDGDYRPANILPATGSSIQKAVAWVNRDRVLFGLISGSVFLASVGFFYYLYGFHFLYEAYLYHFTRTDNRHNFSVYFYDLYLRYNTRAGFSVGLLAFLPQLASLVTISIAYGKDLPFALFALTMVFVIFNKVCTAQYFLWYTGFLPLILPTTSLSFRWKGLLLVLGWLGCELHWLFWAYHLEMQGHNTFFQIWVAGLLFFLVNIVVLATLMRHHASFPLFHRGSVARLMENKTKVA
ncbi:TPA: hypothetical protein N0F65_012330 [Lagenidium giganteum]|uniref:signal-recognition-particle GTPase n=1 Tax=Lagenidium giganteum TaxID=4803 RepID=A0AAV2YSI0_9STRA|nr:TPA: hypothetical protein N0F65_012330 [Lagenidium giganteum]